MISLINNDDDVLARRVTWLGLGLRRGESRRPSAPPSHTGTDDGHMPSSLPMCDGGVPYPLAEFLTSCPPPFYITLKLRHPLSPAGPVDLTSSLRPSLPSRYPTAFWNYCVLMPDERWDSSKSGGMHLPSYSRNRTAEDRSCGALPDLS